MKSQTPQGNSCISSHFNGLDLFALQSFSLPHPPSFHPSRHLLQKLFPKLKKKKKRKSGVKLPSYWWCGHGLESNFPNSCLQMHKETHATDCRLTLPPPPPENNLLLHDGSSLARRFAPTRPPDPLVHRISPRTAIRFKYHRCLPACPRAV